MSGSLGTLTFICSNIMILNVPSHEVDMSDQQDFSPFVEPAAEEIDQDQAELLMQIEEGEYSDVKSILVSPAKLTNAISAFANTDGGDLYIGISEQLLGGNVKKREWAGFPDVEAANGHLQPFRKSFPLGRGFQYEFLRCPALQGVVLHAQISRTQEIIKATDGIAYIRVGAQNLPQTKPEELRRLEYAKGLISFESHTVAAENELIIDSPITKQFVNSVVPKAQPEAWLRKQQLIVNQMPTVAGLLLFAEEPQSALPKRCGIKVYRYKTQQEAGFRDVLTFVPITVEGCLYDQIKKAVKTTVEEIEKIPHLGAEGLEQIKYPQETLHEIITNAVIHRDYSIADDIHVRIFDNRIEVQSPGRLPAHITPNNILDERFARNGVLVRLLNKFPNPPNQDVGEGLNTAFDKMKELGLRAPIIEERGDAVLVRILHEPLASPEDTIMKYLETHETIRNQEAREITFTKDADHMKRILQRMAEGGEIEKIGKGGGQRYRKTL
jgi:ATP-dependent DNA helicase RecG